MEMVREKRKIGGLENGERAAEETGSEEGEDAGTNRQRFRHFRMISLLQLSFIHIYKNKK